MYMANTDTHLGKGNKTLRGGEGRGGGRDHRTSAHI